MIKFHETQSSEFQPVSSENNYLIERYGSIQNFLGHNFSEEYHNLLAKPVRKGKVIEWYARLSGDIRPVESFPEQEKIALLSLYNARRHEIERKCTQLRASKDFDSNGWARMLSDAFDPNHIQIFSDGKDVILVWGIQTRRKDDYVLPERLYAAYIVPFEAPLDEPESLPNNEDDAPYVNADLVVPVDTETSELDQGEQTTEPSISKDEKPINEEPIIEEPIKEEPIIEVPRKPEIPSKKAKHWFYAMLDQFEIFASQYWWLLLILVLLFIFLIIWWLKSPVEHAALTPVEIDRVYKEIMPEKPRVRKTPIDTTRFRDDDETGNTVVAGLLNIAMVDQKEKFKQLAVELKKIFPEASYEISYFDDVTHRLQLNYPEQDTNIRKTIQEQLATYRLLMWDESIFRVTLAVDDPFMNEAEKSWHLTMVNAPLAWDKTVGDTSVVVAIIDDGFDLQHPELNGKNIVKPYNVVTDDSNITSSDEVLHGTHVAAIALGNSNNASGACGIAPGCSFMPIQAGSPGGFFTGTDIIDGVLYALNNGADVVNMSLGKLFGETAQGMTPDQLLSIIRDYGTDEEIFWKELFSLANDKNITIVLAGGNEALPIGMDPMQRSNSTLKVLAVGRDMKRAEFSNYQSITGEKNNFISAPGVQIFSAIPGNRFSPLDGTSMAAPIVSGAVALMKSRKNGITNHEIFEVLNATAKPSLERNGAPLLQVDKALMRLNP